MRSILRRRRLPRRPQLSHRSSTIEALEPRRLLSTTTVFSESPYQSYGNGAETFDADFSQEPHTHASWSWDVGYSVGLRYASTTDVDFTVSIDGEEHMRM